MSTHLANKTPSSDEQDWICANCGKNNRSRRSFCWNCETLKDSPGSKPPEPEKSSQPQPRNERPLATQVTRCPHCGADGTVVRSHCTNCGTSLIGSEASNTDASQEHKHRIATGDLVFLVAFTIVILLIITAVIKLLVVGSQNDIGLVLFVGFMLVMSLPITDRGIKMLQGKIRYRPLGLLSHILNPHPRRTSGKPDLSSQIRGTGLVVIGLGLGVSMARILLGVIIWW